MKKESLTPVNLEKVKKLRSKITQELLFLEVPCYHEFVNSVLYHCEKETRSLKVVIKKKGFFIKKSVLFLMAGDKKLSEWELKYPDGDISIDKINLWISILSEIYNGEF